MTTVLPAREAPDASAAVRNPVPPKAPKRRRIPRHILFLIPAAVFMGIFGVFPLIQLVWLSLHDVTQSTLNADDWTFVGLGNYIRGFTAGESADALYRTLVVVTIVTIGGMGLGFIAAVALRTKGRWSGILLAIMVFVWALPPVVNGSVWKFLLAENGLLNTIIRGVGLPSIPFLYDPEWALISVACVAAFAVIPFNALVYRAALMTIDPEVFEAAAIDGASKWQEVRYVMIPAVRSTTLVLFVLTVVYGFRSFDFIYVMTFGGPGTSTSTLPFLGYLQAFNQYNYGIGAATSFLAVLGVFALAAAYAWSIRREESER